MKLNLKNIVVLISLAIMGLIGIQMVWISNAIEVRKSQFDQEVKTSLVVVTQEIPRVIRQNQEVNFFQKQQQFNQGVTDISALINAMLDNTPFQKFSDKITKKQLDSLIHFQMTKRGITTPYIFGVFDASGNLLFEEDSIAKNNSAQLLTEGLNIPVYVDDFMLTQPFISIIFPKKNNFIFKKMWLILSISFLLILAVIYAFYFTVNTIRKQKQLSEIKNDFINNMTHELKTPISTIQLACEALTDADMNSKESQHTFIEMIRDENTRLKGLVDTVLKTAILDKGQMKLQKEEVDLLAIINKVRGNFSLQINQLNGKIILDNDLPEMPFLGDKQHLTNVFQNLIDNAIKYTTRVPEIKITTAKTIDSYLIKVSDNGIGIGRENLDKIFEKLYRVPNGDLHNVKGFGLGLNYVKSMIEIHEGKIDAKSIKGQGSTFTLSLPILK